MQDQPITELERQLATDSATAAILKQLKAAPALAELLEAALPLRSKMQQRALMLMAMWRLMGVPLPASIELITHTPMFAGQHPDTAQAPFHELVTAGVIQFDELRGVFVWPALEGAVHAAAEAVDGPVIVDVGGRSLRH